jgi:putative ABC transport system permease protein
VSLEAIADSRDVRAHVRVASYPTSSLINKLVIENLKHRPVRTLLSILAIGIQVTMVLTLVGLSTGMLEEQARRYRGIGADIVVRAGGSSAISLSVNLRAKWLPYIAEKPHVVAASGVLIESTGFLTTIHGVDLPSFNRLNGGFRFQQGGPFQRPDDIIIDSYYAREHKLKLNDRAQVMNQSWCVRGIFEPGMLARLVVPLARLQELYSASNQLTAIYVKVDNQQNIQRVIDTLREAMHDDQIVPMEEYVSLFSVNSIPMLKQFIYIVIALGVLVGFLVVFLSMYTAVLERTREIGILKALGASPAYVVRILLRETFFLAVCGSVIGILITFGTRWIINDVTQGPLIQAIVPLWWPIAAGIAIVGALLGATYPGLKAARQNAIEALAYE